MKSKDLKAKMEALQNIIADIGSDMSERLPKKGKGITIIEIKKGKPMPEMKEEEEEGEEHMGPNPAILEVIRKALSKKK